jgi:hypothetical protein
MLVVGLSGCGSDKDSAMPAVTGKKLDVAKSDIKRAGFKDDVEVLGGGTFGVVKESNWEVCEQTPAAGEPLTKPPRLEVERDCNKDDVSPSEEPSAEPTPVATAKSASPPTKPIVDITVDALLDKLNAGDTEVWDQFRFTGELFQEDLWSTGATGEYSVLLKAKGGKQDLFVFIDEAKAASWHDGTRVEMVVRVEERTIDDETSDGWLNVMSVKTLSG